MIALQFFKALSDETRLKSLLLILAQQELCVCELMSALSLSQPKISRHLAILKDASLLETRRQGQWIFYFISPQLPAWQLLQLQQTLSNSVEFIAPHLNHLNEMGSRPVRVASCCPE